MVTLVSWCCQLLLQPLASTEYRAAETAKAFWWACQRGCCPQGTVPLSFRATTTRVGGGLMTVAVSCFLRLQPHGVCDSLCRESLTKSGLNLAEATRAHSYTPGSEMLLYTPRVLKRASDTNNVLHFHYSPS